MAKVPMKKEDYDRMISYGRMMYGLGIAVGAFCVLVLRYFISLQ